MDHSSLPSIDTLRAFDAAVRLGSLTRAAAHVHLTHGAVSRRIAALEEDVGVSLLTRLPRGVAPTTEGLRLHAAFTDVLERLRSGLAEVGAKRAANSRVRISVLPSFAAHFLMSRLARFYEAHPEIDLELVAESRVAEPGRDGIDLAIRYGSGNWPGVRAKLLLAEDLVPVCAPSRLRSGTLDRRLFSSQTVLHDSDGEGWRVWQQAAGWRSSGRRQVTYSDYNLVLEAAANGLGFAIGRSVLIGDLLSSGRLVRAHKRTVRSPRQYYLITCEGSPSVSAGVFVDWLRSECRRVRA